MVGSALVRQLQAKGFTNLLTRSSKELNLCEQEATRAFFAKERPDHVLLAAAKVGGILANSTYPADFIRDNLLIETNVIDAAWRNGVKKLLFLGSSCIYPRLATQPMPEEALLTGDVEATNQWYALAKIAGIKMCQAYRRQHGFNAICAMPTNLYGPGDNFDLNSSHVIPALIRKVHEAKKSGSDHITVWGTGKALREFLHVDDMAQACMFLMENYDDESIVNVGTGDEISIAELVGTIAEVVGFRGEIRYDTTKPDGTPRKLLDVSKLTNLGWKAETSLKEGLRRTYRWFEEREEASDISGKRATQ